MSISPKIGQICAGLKMYLNDTFSELKMENISEWIEVLIRLRNRKYITIPCFLAYEKIP